ncbi:superoxide dismutase family protein [Balneola sp. MJW-20]|uniref:superoxide dismutase family protein n=1 Tax=Gracilimonas aurantiaca TaxID=3234185 RepID=UPI003467AC0B
MKKLISLLSLLLFTFACTQKEVEKKIIMKGPANIEKATATVMTLGDNDVTGTVTFTNTPEGVRVTGTFQGLEEGLHGFHIHQYGDCSAEDGSSAGGHFNPIENDHGSPNQDNRHMGDLGNLAVDADGIGTIEYVDETIVMNEIIGRGVIIHAGEDDMMSQPSGAAGSRIACGVVGIANSSM